MLLQLDDGRQTAKVLPQIIVDLLLQNRACRCDPQWSRGELSTRVWEAFHGHEAKKEADRQRRSEEITEHQKEREARLAREIEEDERRERERKADTAKTKKIADALGISLRRARDLRSDGTTIEEHAEEIAAILGTRPEEHLRRPRRPGRKTDVVAALMRVDPDGLSGFASFIDDADTNALDDDARDLINVISEQHTRDFTTLESLITRLAKIEFGLFEADTAVKVWRAYQLWKINRITDAARAEIEHAKADHGRDLMRS
jgi:hypothetical protein